MISGERFSAPVFFPVGVEMQGFYKTVMWVRGFELCETTALPIRSSCTPCYATLQRFVHHYMSKAVVIVSRLRRGNRGGLREICSGILNVPTPMLSPDATLCLTIWT